MGEKRKTTVYFGGEAHEQWTERGLEVSYSGRTPAVAVFDGDTLTAEAPEPGRAGDVKAGYNELARWQELAARLNNGSVSPLSSAYFRASAEISLSLAADAPDWRTMDERYSRTLSGGAESIAIVELLRVLLDEKRAAWDEAVDTVSRCFELRIPEVRPGAPVPLAAVRALQPRDAELIGVLNEKLCSRLWDAWPGDWLRIGESAIVRDDEADLTMLAAAMCLRIYCTKEELAGSLRALYTLDPARFTEL